MSHPVETYLTHLQQIHATGGGTAEESYYGPLENLFNDIGGKLKPKVRAVQQLANRGSGEPDFGFYTADQFQRGGDPIAGLGPERGAAEVKPWTDDVFAVAAGRQVARYLQGYRLVLVTNYREFVLITLDESGRAMQLESCSLASSAAAFMGLLAHPRAAADSHGDRLTDFLRRVLLHRAPLSDPADLAFFLASYAREARARIETAGDLKALAALKGALEEALGMKFEDDKGDHFFRATLVQTLFYGVFSSWVLWCRDRQAGGRPDGDRFDWRQAAWTLHVPMIRGLFDQIATPSRLKPLGIDEVLDWAGNALNRVDRAAFFHKFEEDHAVQYFYEPFLKAYDPELRKQLGVWYTPPEIVRYQVERVDRVLRDELGLADGLADPGVVVLDPCCGTGAYLVETLRRIHATLEEKGAGALAAQRLKQAAAGRVFGFELLPAPFVVAHLQLGLLLRTLGAPLDDEAERAGVYLTNSLTGWEPPDAARPHLLFPELEAERDAADRVKREKKILVVLGNPPYNAFAGVSPEEEGGLVDVYKEGLNKPPAEGGWGIKKFNLDDLYVRFFRIAERRIALSGEGVVSFISNYSWTQEPSFVVLRQRLLEAFDKFWIENMHGNRKISEYAPDGRTSETVFAIPGFSEGIQQGVVISLWVRRKDHVDEPGKQAEVLYRDDLNAAKAVERRADLLAGLDEPDFDAAYEVASPAAVNRFSFRPVEVGDNYLSWPTIEDLADFKPSLGILENRGDSLIRIDLEPLEQDMSLYLDADLSWTELEKTGLGILKNAARYDAKATRIKVLGSDNKKKGAFTRILVRPMDTRWCYYSQTRPLWNEPRPNYYDQIWDDNVFIVTRRKGVARVEGTPFNFTRIVGFQHGLNTDAYYTPIRVRKTPLKSISQGKLNLFADEDDEPFETANLSPTARAWLNELGLPDPDGDAETAALVWLHALAVGYSPAYLSDNADGIRGDWPRVPLPASAAALRASAALGARVAALLDTERPVGGVTAGAIRPELRDVAVIRRAGGGQLDPQQGHLDLTAGWGHAGKGGVTMPGRGRITNYEIRDTSEEGGAPSPRHPFSLSPRLNVWLNDDAYWGNVPAAVWDYTIGGYQVIKKWLSYRERPLLGRGLTLDEVEYVTHMARRLAALVLLRPELDENYRAVVGDVWAWRPTAVDRRPTAAGS